MTDKTIRKGRKFAHEILAMAGISLLAAALLLWILVNIASTVAEVYCFEHNVSMSEFDWITVDRWIFGVAAVLAVCLFCGLFLSLMGERLAYIRTITHAIDTMRLEKASCQIPLEGQNELTELAAAINYMTEARQRLLEKERALVQEKEQLIRSLSHDIRTPLTVILSSSEYLTETPQLSEHAKNTHLHTIRRKAEQIRELTGLLLEGAKREPEHFTDARLLMEQLAEEFREELEEEFPVTIDFSECAAFEGSFDVKELRRIFDNLISNVKKYAHPDHSVCLTVRTVPEGVLIRQTNRVLPREAPEDSYRLGISSIRRIAQNYGGSVEVQESADTFAVSVSLNAAFL